MERPPLDEAWLAKLVPAYERLLARYLLGDTAAERVRALSEAGALARTLAPPPPAAVGHVLELHRRAQKSLARRWLGRPGDEREQSALGRLAQGDSLALLEALWAAQASPPVDAAPRVPAGQDWPAEQARLAAEFEASEDLLVVLREDGSIENVNPAFARATGWSRLEMLSRIDAMWQGPRPLHGCEHVHLDQRRRDGSVFKAAWLVWPVLSDDGRVLHHVCVGRDLDKQQRISEALRENDKLRAVATLAGGLAHDFNNMLGSINGLAELCELEAPPGSRLARNLSRIRQAGSSAAVLVRHLLDYARQRPKTVGPVAAFALVEHAAALLHARLPASISLTVDRIQNAVTCIDFVQVEQVLMNLASNAIHAMRAHGGELRIAVDRADPRTPPDAAAAAGFVRLRVIDTGEGMSPEVMARVFDPFFTTKAVGEGTGLGLSAVQGIVASHGGTVEVESVPGRGSTFSIYLPCAEQALPVHTAGP